MRGGPGAPGPGSRGSQPFCLLQVPRPDGRPDHLGLLVLDEPSTKQSDPAVLSLWLTENSRQHNVAVSRGGEAARVLLCLCRRRCGTAQSRALTAGEPDPPLAGSCRLPAASLGTGSGSGAFG